MTAIRRSREPTSKDKLARLAQLVLYAHHRAQFTLAELGRDAPEYGVQHLGAIVGGDDGENHTWPIRGGGGDETRVILLGLGRALCRCA